DIVPDDIKPFITTREELGGAIDWRRNDELLRYIQLSKIFTSTQMVWSGEAREEELEKLGYEVLAYNQAGPMFLRKRVGSDVTYYQLFHTDESTLPLSPVEFVPLMQNLVTIAMHQTGLAEASGRTTGVLSPLK